MERDGQAIQNFPRTPQLFPGSVFGHITGENDEIEALLTVDIADGDAEVLIRHSGADVGVTQPGEFEGLPLCAPGQKQAQGDRDHQTEPDGGGDRRMS